MYSLLCICIYFQIYLSILLLFHVQHRKWGLLQDKPDQLDSYFYRFSLLCTIILWQPQFSRKRNTKLNPAFYVIFLTASSSSLEPSRPSSGFRLMTPSGRLVSTGMPVYFIITEKIFVSAITGSYLGYVYQPTASTKNRTFQGRFSRKYHEPKETVLTFGASGLLLLEAHNAFGSQDFLRD